MPDLPKHLRPLLVAAATFVAASCGLWEHFGDEGPGDSWHQPRAQVSGHNVGPAMPTATAAGLAPAIHVDGTDFKDESGKVVQLKGVNWFGFNVDDNGGPLGLWTPGVAGDFAHTVHRQRLLGFNAWRIPFSFAVFDHKPKSYKSDCPDISTQDLAKDTLDPQVQGADLAKAFDLPAPPQREPGKCNGYLPESTIKDRLIWATQFILAQGGYVLLDNHLREDETAKTNPAMWAASWAALIKQVMAMPGAEGRIIVDLLNEPGQRGITWDGGTPGGLGALYLSAMDAISQVSDKVIFLIEGTGQDGLNINWGDGFVADDALIKQHGLSDPRPFFEALAAKPYAKRVVLGPHVYGPSVTHAPADFAGEGLAKRLTASFGGQQVQGITTAAGKLTFPVAIGEFGSTFQDAADTDFLHDFAAYLSHADDHHKAIDNFFYWCWNADSGDTGGLVKGDYKEIEWTKIRYLETVGLVPWYRQANAAAPTSSPAATPTSSTPQPPAATNGASTAGPSDAPSASGQPAPAQPVPSAPSTSQAPATQPPPAESVAKAPDATIRPKEPAPLVTTALSSDGCECEVDMSGQWTEGDTQFASLNLYLRNGGGAPIPVPFSFSVTHPEYTQVGMSWNLADITCKQGNIEGKAEQGWQALLPHGGNIVPVGFLVSSKGHDLMPKTITINQRKCVITVCKR